MLSITILFNFNLQESMSSQQLVVRMIIAVREREFGRMRVQRREAQHSVVQRQDGGGAAAGLPRRTVPQQPCFILLLSRIHEIGIPLIVQEPRTSRRRQVPRLTFQPTNC